MNAYSRRKLKGLTAKARQAPIDAERKEAADRRKKHGKWMFLIGMVVVVAGIVTGIVFDMRKMNVTPFAITVFMGYFVFCAGIVQWAVQKDKWFVPNIFLGLELPIFVAASVTLWVLPTDEIRKITQIDPMLLREICTVMLFLSVFTLIIGVRNYRVYSTPGMYIGLTGYSVVFVALLPLAALEGNGYGLTSFLGGTLISLMVLTRMMDLWKAWNEEPA